MKERSKEWGQWKRKQDSTARASLHLRSIFFCVFFISVSYTSLQDFCVSLLFWNSSTGCSSLTAEGEMSHFNTSIFLWCLLWTDTLGPKPSFFLDPAMREGRHWLLLMEQWHYKPNYIYDPLNHIEVVWMNRELEPELILSTYCQLNYLFFQPPFLPPPADLLVTSLSLKSAAKPVADHGEKTWNTPWVLSTCSQVILIRNISSLS